VVATDGVREAQARVNGLRDTNMRVVARDRTGEGLGSAWAQSRGITQGKAWDHRGLEMSLSRDGTQHLVGR